MTPRMAILPIVPQSIYTDLVIRVSRSWASREWKRAADGLMARGFIDIRTIASHPECVGDPAAALERIRMIADTCHNLPGATRSHRKRNTSDPFVWLWHMAAPSQREWVAQVLRSLRLETGWLDNAAPGPSSLPNNGNAT
jgi:hypothetical protein